MFIRPFQGRFLQYQSPDDEGGGGGGEVTLTENESGAGTEEDFDFSSAIDEIAKTLGESDDKGTAAPAPTPVATPVASPAAPEVPKTPAAAPVPAAPGPRVYDLTVAPKTWKGEVAALWATAVVDPQIRAEIHRREEDFHQGVAGYREDAALARPIKEILAPYGGIFKQHNIDPVGHIKVLLQSHHTLATGTPEQRLGLLRSLASSYGVQLTAAPLPGEAPFLDPQVSALQQEVQRLSSVLDGTVNSVQAERQSKLTTEVNAFAAAPGHEHFDEVAGEITSLLKANFGMTLDKAYEAATWANPSVRQKLLEAQAADAAKATQEAADRVAAAAAEAAKASTINVKPRARPATATGKVGSVDDTLRETLAAIQAKG